ncbi:MAG: metabolite traffic protein EboE, partial [Rhodothermales bacterium]
TNIHPGETWAAVETNLREYTLPLKELVSPHADFGVGLRLSNQAAEDLLSGGDLDRFREWLDGHGLYVYTLNGFPYGGFHRQVVKDDVYRPEWSDPERLAYTRRLINILAEVLPSNLEGSISTSPLSYKPWLADSEQSDVMEASALNFAEAAFTMFDLRERTDRLIHVGIEPEPDCLIENTAETVAWFEDYLLRHGASLLRSVHGLSRGQAEEALRSHIRVCYDTCHLAVEFEEPEYALSTFRGAGIELSKVQISAALRVPLAADRADLARDLETFAESTYLHQVVARRADGSLSHYPDLPAAMPDLPDTDDEEWRIHYHVPIFVDRYEHLYSTQRDIVAALEWIQRERPCAHLEIETYTWDVLPPDLKTDVVTSLQREFEWTLAQLKPKP